MVVQDQMRQFRFKFVEDVFGISVIGWIPQKFAAGDFIEGGFVVVCNEIRGTENGRLIQPMGSELWLRPGQLPILQTVSKLVS